MGTKTTVGLLTLLMVCSCSGKKETEKLQPVKVRTETVGTGTAGGGQSYTGTVEETNGVSLSFNTGGTLKQLLVDEGQVVGKGQLIGIVDAQNATNTVALSRSGVQQAEAAYRQAQDAYKRMKMMHDNGSLPDIKWTEAQSKAEQARSALEGARAQERIASKGLGDTRLYAPFSGYISKKQVEAGQTVSPGLPVVTLVKIDQVKVKISVPESEISRLANGTTVSIRVDALGGKTLTGRIIEKNVSADALSHTYDVKALVANPGHQLLPGMIAEVTTTAPAASAPLHGQGSILLPADIVQIDADNRTFVWTVAGGKARQTYITTAGNSGGNVVVASGLQAGDKVIVSGQQKVSGGMDVTE